jgi:hypothetical protein
MIGWRLLAVVSVLLLALASGRGEAHEGHDHDKPPALNLPVAPRVVSVTPDFELVGVVSGKGRLTIFLHTFATNEAIKGARLTLSSGSDSAEAEAKGDGVFTVAAPWLAKGAATDIVFELTLADGRQDLLSGRLETVSVEAPVVPARASEHWAIGRMRQQPELVVAAIGGAIGGVLLSLLLAGAMARRGDRRTGLEAGRLEAGPTAAATASVDGAAPGGDDRKGGVTPLRRSASVNRLIGAALIAWLGFPGTSEAGETQSAASPSIAATMATDLAQRMPDGTLFVPKATQHLLSVRTMLTAVGSSPRAVELTGAVIAGPGRLGRVQPGRPGRIEAPEDGLAYVGKRVEKGQTLAYVQTYIEAADRANIDSQIAETEARINKNRTILSRYDKSPGSVPQVKVDEIRGELEALRRKRAELVPAAGRREPVIAPIGGIVSVSHATSGQIVDARDVLFEIVDPTEYWVEAIAYDASAAQNLEKAHAVAGGTQIPLEFAGRGLALRQQAVVLSFKVVGAHEKLAIGKPVQVVLQSTMKVDGIVLPASAVVRGQTGLPIVWVKTEAERFEPQTVKVQPLDGRAIVVTSGLKEGLRIVTEGVTLLNQIR